MRGQWLAGGSDMRGQWLAVVKACILTIIDMEISCVCML